MKELTVIIKPEKLEILKQIVEAHHCNGMTISTVMGCGTQKGYAGDEVGGDFRAAVAAAEGVEEHGPGGEHDSVEGREEDGHEAGIAADTGFEDGVGGHGGVVGNIGEVVG